MSKSSWVCGEQRNAAAPAQMASPVFLEERRLGGRETMREIAKILVGIRRYMSSETPKTNARLKRTVRSARKDPDITASGASVVTTADEWLWCEALLCAATRPGSIIGPLRRRDGNGGGATNTDPNRAVYPMTGDTSQGWFSPRKLDIITTTSRAMDRIFRLYFS